MPAPKRDAVLAAAVDLAREAAESIAPVGTVGKHLGVVMHEDRVASHAFACTQAGYRGWQWTVTVTRISRSKQVTVSETNLLPGPEALLSPDWLPYEERLAPGDIGPGIVLPYRADDPLLEQGFEATGDEEVDRVGFFELGLGRVRVLSAEGREEAAQRWYDGEHGPHHETAARAQANCGTCGYYLPMSGALRNVFGVCANLWSPSDGKVVSLDHGCGAHSETHEDVSAPVPVPAPMVDDFDLVDISAGSGAL